MSKLDSILNTRASESRSNVPDGYRSPVVPAIRCADGATLSVQASELHCCSPRHNGPGWESVEVGFPNPEPPESWSRYFDGDWGCDDRTSSVYGGVPIFLVSEYIESHGGEV